MFEDLILSLGYAGLFAVIFAETGLLIGFFLPGDTLLFSAGVLAAAGLFQLHWLIVVCAIAAVLGDSVGYYLGLKYGQGLFKKNSGLFKKENLKKAEAFYAKHGSLTIVLARFVPVIRTFAPTLAGTARMSYVHFLVYNVIGGVLWVLTGLLLGFYLGKLIPNLSEYISVILLAIVVVSLAPVIYRFVFKKTS